MGKQWSSREILELSGAYWQAFALHAGVVLDIFTAIDNESAKGKNPGLAELGEIMHCAPRGLAMLLSALVALGFISQSGEHFSLSEDARRNLSRNSDEYIGHIIQHHAFLSPGWSRLPEAVSRGLRVQRRNPTHTGENLEREAFLLGMFNIAEQQAVEIAAHLDFSGRKRLIDIGGGPGAYAVHFCKANPELSATILDLPSTEPIARKIIRRFNMESRIDFVAGNFLRNSLPGGYDIAWMSQVLHGEDPEKAALAVSNTARCLNPGGLLVIQEFVLNDDRSGPLHPALFSLNMLINTDKGQAYTWSELEKFLRDAGPESVSRADIVLPQGCGILVGRMPS